MFIQTQPTPNPDSLKFLPGKAVSNSGSYEIKKKDRTNNNLIRNVLSISGVKSVFLGVITNTKSDQKMVFGQFWDEKLTKQNLK